MSGGRNQQERQRKGNAGKGEHECKGGEVGRKGKQHETKTRRDENNGKGHELGRMAPNMEAGGSYPQAISDPEKEEKRETRGMRWTDCEDDEGKKEKDREQEKEKETRQETGQEELTNEKPPGSEQREESEYQRKRGERRRHERS